MSTFTSLLNNQLISELKTLVQDERQLVTNILRHLREVERRKLFSELGYSSLFEFAVKELKYSEGQAGRRIQAMRLIKELPELEQSIASGELSLSNAAQAQNFFRNLQKNHQNEGLPKPISKEQKLDVLSALKNKSSREGQKILLQLAPAAAVPQDRERVLGEDLTSVHFVMNDTLKNKLEDIRALLGLKAIGMGFADLFETMADFTVIALQEKKFGKRRVRATQKDKDEQILCNNAADLTEDEHQAHAAGAHECEPRADRDLDKNLDNSVVANSGRAKPTPAQEEQTEMFEFQPKSQRYIPQKIKHAVWLRDHGQCQSCGSKRNLNYDHIQPVAFGGRSELDNLMLLCFSCNQRRAMKTFGDRPLANV